MLQEVTQRVTLFLLLQRIDLDLAEQTRLERCPHCGGPVHYSRYPRKPRGGPDDIPEDACKRHSLCCGREGCRHRVLPPSCLFMGRRVYWGVAVLVVVTLRQQRLKGFSAEKIKELFGVSEKTLERWMEFYREEFPSSPQWKRLRGRLGVVVKNSELPASLLEQFVRSHRDEEKGLIACLHFMAVGRACPSEHLR